APSSACTKEFLCEKLDRSFVVDSQSRDESDENSLCSSVLCSEQSVHPERVRAWFQAKPSPTMPNNARTLNYHHASHSSNPSCTAVKSPPSAQCCLESAT